MVNASGEEFFNQQQDDPLAYGPYTVQLKALAKQVHAGKARYEGGYFAGFDNCEAGEVEAYTSYGKGLPAARPAISRRTSSSAAVTAHYRQGGSMSTPRTMRSSVPGLYVAGGLGGHSNGPIGLATYDGKIVADGVAQDLPTLKAGVISGARKSNEKPQRIDELPDDAPRRGAGGEGQDARFAHMMWDKAGVEKDEAEPQARRWTTSPTSVSTCCRGMSVAHTARALRTTSGSTPSTRSIWSMPAS